MADISGWGSHIPMLCRVLAITNGPCLELGTGVYSTSVFNMMTRVKSRPMSSYENNPEFYQAALRFRTRWHKVELVKNWDDVSLNRPCSVALIDHTPRSRRRVDIARLASFAEYVVAHDAQPEKTVYGYETVYPLFQYRYFYDACWPPTVVLSNFHELDWLARP